MVRNNPNPRTTSHHADAAPTSLGQVLIDWGDLTPAQLREALAIQSSSTCRLMLGEVIVQQGWLSPDRLLQAIAAARGLAFIEDLAAACDPGARALVPPDLRERHTVIPVRLDGGELIVATAEPEDFFVLEDLSKASGFRVRFVVAPADAIRAALAGGAADEPTPSRANDQAEEIFAEVDEAQFTVAENEAADLAAEDTTGTSGPVVKLVNFIIAGAVADGASDIHIEPDDGSLRIRYRIDGVLSVKTNVPWRMHAAISSRVKIMARLDISERRVPQDGEIAIKVNGKPIDLRVSTLPGKFGEKIVMRVIDTSYAKLGLEKLGFRPAMLDRFRAVVDEPHGVVLVTGPTGSGKSTTLYSVLQQFDTTELNLSTVEDPVESNLPGVHQAQVNVKAGLTFAGALRALLRQDPDIIMVGEIRDGETAQIAVQAALTGHMVFSTLHTNDAPSAVTRLQNLGVEPFLVAAALRGVLAQRLVRRICKHCKAEYEPDAAERAAMGEFGAQAERLWKGTGCRTCHERGLSGRLGLYELLVPDADVLEAISARTEPAALKRLLRDKGFETLWVDGMRKVIDGLTTTEEVHGACRH
jgi:type IV pilus assembly protein PilB